MSHPSEVVNKYLLTKVRGVRSYLARYTDAVVQEPSARIAVTHDIQWIAMLEKLKVGDVSSPTIVIQFNSIQFRGNHG